MSGVARTFTLTVGEGEPLQGTISVNGDVPHPFVGWVELMAAIDAARFASPSPETIESS
jgi:hypothetical protein